MIRELDISKSFKRAEKPLGRLLHRVVEQYRDGRPILKVLLLRIKALAEQGLVEGQVTKLLITSPLTASSLQTRSLANIAVKGEYIHVPSTSEETMQCKILVPYWRLPEKNHIGRQSDGYLSLFLQREYMRKLDSFRGGCASIISQCQELLDRGRSFECEVEDIANYFQPCFNLSPQEIFQYDSDDDLPTQVTSSVKPTSSNVVRGPVSSSQSLHVAPGLRMDSGRNQDSYAVGNNLRTNSAQFDDGPEIGFVTSYDEPGSYSPPREPGSHSPPRTSGTPMSNASDHPSTRSASSRDTLSNMPVTSEEFSESIYWMSAFSTSSPSVQVSNRKNVDFRLERELIKAFEVLEDFQWLKVLRFIESLQVLNAASPNAAVTWQLCISQSIQPDIVTRHTQVYGQNGEALPHGSLSDITCQQMVKVLGRICEANAFEAFKRKVTVIFSRSEYAIDLNKPRVEQWQKLQKAIHMLHVIVPVFGRLLGRLGSYIHSQDSNFIKLLHEILPETLVGPLFDRIYSPDVERRERNVIYDLPPNPSQWQWKHAYKLLRLLQAEVTVEADLDRQNEERMLVFAPPSASGSRAKLVSMNADSDEESSNDRHLSAYSQGRQSTTHAYGKSGSGEGTTKLWNTVRTEPVFSDKPSKQVSFTKSPRNVCFKDAQEEGTCPYGKDCKYLHPDRKKLDELTLLAEHLSAQLRGSARRSPSASLHMVTEESSKEDFGDVDKED